LELTSKAFDGVLRLETLDGKRLIVDDQGGHGVNPKIQFTALEGGRHRLVATSHHADQVGPYYILAARLETPPGQVSTKVLEKSEALTTKDEFDDQITKSRRKVIEVFLEANREYHIFLKSMDFDPMLRLLDMQGKTLAVNDDDGISMNSWIRYRPRVSGTYRIVATSWEWGRTGEFTLIVGY
jgi:hypothetical protein